MEELSGNRRDRPVERHARMRMLRVRRIMDRVDRRLSRMRARIMRPMATRARRPVELMVRLLSGGGWCSLVRDLHRVPVTGGTRGRAGGRPLGGIRRDHAVALVRLAIPEALGERVARDLQLRYPMVLVRGDRGESRLREGKRLKVLGARIRRRARRRGRDHHVAPRLITVHRVEDDLQRERIIANSTYLRVKRDPDSRSRKRALSLITFLPSYEFLFRRKLQTLFNPSSSID